MSGPTGIRCRSKRNKYSTWGVLKKAGVVDSGGRGLIIVFTGMYKALINDETLKINYEQFDTVPKTTQDEVEAMLDLGDIEFAYCTEYMIIEMKPKTTEADIEASCQGLGRRYVCAWHPVLR